ncbi:MAG: helix-turn-helix domain-containing protein [Candidatus Limnocylindrales bacterium]
MRQLLDTRTASVLLLLSERPEGATLSELAHLVSAPLSSLQRNIESLEDDGVVIRDRRSRPRYRLAADAPRDGIAQVAEWRLPQEAAEKLRQQAAAMSAASDPSVDSTTALRTALRDPGRAKKLEDMARRLIWWQPARATLKEPARLIAQVMAVGSWEDMEFVESIFGEAAFRDVLGKASPGVFGPRAWAYWHARLGYKRTPPLPKRAVG